MHEKLNLAEMRKELALSQKKLSELTGIDQSDISKIERGAANPSIATLQRLADGMGVSLKIEFVKSTDTEERK